MEHGMGPDQTHLIISSSSAQHDRRGFPPCLSSCPFCVELVDESPFIPVSRTPKSPSGRSRWPFQPSGGTFGSTRVDKGLSYFSFFSLPLWRRRKGGNSWQNSQRSCCIRETSAGSSRPGP